MQSKTKMLYAIRNNLFNHYDKCCDRGKKSYEYYIDETDISLIQKEINDKLNDINNTSNKFYQQCQTMRSIFQNCNMCLCAVSTNCQNQYCLLVKLLRSIEKDNQVEYFYKLLC